MYKRLVAFSFIISGLLLSHNTFAATTTSLISSTPDKTYDRGLFHVDRYTAAKPLRFLGLINDRLIATFNPGEHIWWFGREFVDVTGENPALTLGYPAEAFKPSASMLSVPKGSPCAKYKDAISATTLSTTKTLCLSSSIGGDFTVRLLDTNAKEKTLSVGFGKQPILEKTRVSWIGIDGNLYIANIHPLFFADTVAVQKQKSSPTVFLLKNGVRYSLASEQMFFSWFDSFKSVVVLDPKKLTATPVVGKGFLRPNSLIVVSGEPTYYLYQPPNDPYGIYGRSVSISENKADRWVIVDPKNKKKTIDLMKRPEQLVRFEHPMDIVQTYGPDWQKHVITLTPEQKNAIPVATDFFSAGKHVLFE